MYDSIIILHNDALTQNAETGVFETVGTASGTKVYAALDSISRSEWYSAGNAGINPAFRFRMPRSSYNGEMVIQFGDEFFAVYRTFTSKNEIELYAQKATGVTYGTETTN